MSYELVYTSIHSSINYYDSVYIRRALTEIVDLDAFLRQQNDGGWTLTNERALGVDSQRVRQCGRSYGKMDVIITVDNNGELEAE